MTGFTGINHNGIYDKWHTCQLQAEQRTVRFEYPGVDATLLWDRPLNPNRTPQVPRTPPPKTLTAPPLSRDLGFGALAKNKFCTDCGISTSDPHITKCCPETGKPH